MVPEDLMVGSLAVAGLLIKTVLSAIKRMFSVSPRVLQLTALACGVPFAFAMDVSMLELAADANWFAVFFSRLLSGLFIGSMAMGLHEGTNLLKKQK